MELAFNVCHLPPGTSMWNKIEYRLFSYVSIHWWGQPMEHAIGGLKVVRMLRDPFRNRKDGLADTAIMVAAGLYNYKCQVRDAVPTNYPQRRPPRRRTHS
jgi:hypothetical protein